MKTIVFGFGLIFLSCTSAYASPQGNNLFAALGNLIINEAQAEPALGHSAYQTGLIYREHRAFRRDHRSRHHSSFYYRHRSDYGDYNHFSSYYNHQPRHGYGHRSRHGDRHGYRHGGFFNNLFH